MKKSVGILGLLLLSWVMVSSASANLIQNGSFEDPVVSNSNNWDVFTSVPNWTLGGDPRGLEIQKNGLFTTWNAYDGLQWAELDGYGNSIISQIVSVTSGTPYHLEFYYSPRPGHNENQLLFSVYGAGVNLSQTISANWGTALTAPFWNLVTLEFTPTSKGSITVLFKENGVADRLGMLLDNASINAVPIPTAAWLLGTGLIGLVVVRRKQKK